MTPQAIENSQKPVNRHPKTGRPVWFCNIHNHARFLRDLRPCSVPEVRASRQRAGCRAKPAFSSLGAYIARAHPRPEAKP